MPFYYPGFEFRGEWIPTGGFFTRTWWKIERRRLPPYPRVDGLVYQRVFSPMIVPEMDDIWDIPEPYRGRVTPGPWFLFDRSGPMHDPRYVWARPLYPIEETKQ